jgi:hypothetical protein
MSTTQDIPSDSTDLRKKAIESFIESYSWSGEYVFGLDELVDDIIEAESRAELYAGPGKTDWYSIVKRHIKCGNNKIAKNTWLWSISPATDCPHLGSDRCQVAKEACYAYAAENTHIHSEDSPGGPLHRKRRLTVIWDLLDADSFAEILCEIHRRKTSKIDIEYFRVNEAGDIRDRTDLLKLNRIAKTLKERVGVTTYLYSASSHLDWSILKNRHFTLNASNDDVALVADRRFEGRFDVHGPEDVDDDEVICPAELHGRDTIKCGECTLCSNPDGPDVVVPIH